MPIESPKQRADRINRNMKIRTLLIDAMDEAANIVGTSTVMQWAIKWEGLRETEELK